MLLKQVYKSQGFKLLRLGDTDVDYSENVNFYITSTLANPHYAPEVCIKVTIAAFLHRWPRAPLVLRALVSDMQTFAKRIVDVDLNAHISTANKAMCIQQTELSNGPRPCVLAAIDSTAAGAFTRLRGGGDLNSAAQEFWASKLAGAAPGRVQLPTEPVPQPPPDEAHVRMPFDFGDRLHALAEKLEVPLPAAAAACLTWTVARHARLADAMLIAVMDTNDGCAGAVLRLVTVHVGTLTLASLTKEAAKQWADASPHIMELNEIVAAGPASWADGEHPVALAVSARAMPLHKRPLDAILSLSLLPNGGAQLCFDGRRIAQKTVEQLSGRIHACAAAQPDDPLVDAPLMHAAEARFVAISCNRTARQIGPHETVHAAFSAAAAACPTSVALRAPSDELTYAELDAHADAVANSLHDLCVAPQGECWLVALHFERSVAMVVAIFGTRERPRPPTPLPPPPPPPVHHIEHITFPHAEPSLLPPPPPGVLKTGAGYLPIDPEYPVKRVAEMLDEAAPAAGLLGNGAHPAAAAFRVLGDRAKLLGSVAGELMPLQDKTTAGESTTTLGRIISVAGAPRPSPAHASSQIYCAS